MDITIEINTDNAAFDGALLESEVSRILTEVSNRLAGLNLRKLAQQSAGTYSRKVYDVNGNNVGSLTITE